MVCHRDLHHQSTINDGDYITDKTSPVHSSSWQYGMQLIELDTANIDAADIKLQDEVPHTLAPPATVLDAALPSAEPDAALTASEPGKAAEVIRTPQECDPLISISEDAQTCNAADAQESNAVTLGSCCPTILTAPSQEPQQGQLKQQQQATTPLGKCMPNSATPLSGGSSICSPGSAQRGASSSATKAGNRKPKSGAHSRVLPGSQPRQARSTSRFDGVCSPGSGMGALTPTATSRAMTSNVNSGAFSPAAPAAGGGGVPGANGGGTPRSEKSEQHLGGGSSSSRKAARGGVGAKGAMSAAAADGGSGGGGVVYATGFCPMHGLGAGTQQHLALARSAAFAMSSMDRSLNRSLRSNQSNMSNSDFRPKWRI